MGQQWFTRGDTNLSGAYSLNALDAAEREAFERQLAKSETLRAEVTEFSDTATLLSDVVGDVTPPEHLKTRILAQIENTPQLAAEEKSEHVFSPTAAQKVRARQPRRNLVLGLGTAMAVVIVGGAGFSAIVASQGQQTPVVQQASGPDLIRQAADAQNATVKTARGEMQVMWSNTTGTAAIRNKDVLTLPADSTYQLWVTDKTGKTVSAGFITSNSPQWTLFGKKIAHGDKLRMTLEPLGGSKQPTSDPLFALDV